MLSFGLSSASFSWSETRGGGGGGGGLFAHYKQDKAGGGGEEKERKVHQARAASERDDRQTNYCLQRLSGLLPPVLLALSRLSLSHFLLSLLQVSLDPLHPDAPGSILKNLHVAHASFLANVEPPYLSIPPPVPPPPVPPAIHHRPCVSSSSSAFTNPQGSEEEEARTRPSPLLRAPTASVQPSPMASSDFNPPAGELAEAASSNKKAEQALMRAGEGKNGKKNFTPPPAHSPFPPPPHPRSPFPSPVLCFSESGSAASSFVDWKERLDQLVKLAETSAVRAGGRRGFNLLPTGLSTG
eukprot:748716-Hanusia_phi.AAC.4